MTTGFPTLATNLYGLRRSLDGLRREAQTTAHAIVDGATADLTGAAVRSMEQHRAAQANAAALRRVSGTRGSVIDILA